MVYRHTALSVLRALLMFWFVGYLRTAEFIFNIRCGDDYILEMESGAVISRERE